ncbi:putative NADH dehydrogenase 78K chain precursor [Neoconidiobolus thromboides FSU 785]|nr:putative NADH dehydrogenase 78K chain precursor [Neoconidiobolus thromboides FSU 785]
MMRLNSKSISLRYINHISKGLRQFSTSKSSKKEVEIFINGNSIKVEEGSALIQACEKAGVDIPRFCYHERLGVAGNCRMCLVELEKSPKPVASCAFPIMPGMKVHTDTPLVKKAREGVMEFLLSNHPLDCPVCDQGGECDLQDQSMRYGSDRSRYLEPAGKRAVENKNFGPLVKTIMTRCIHCTRCVRFANEVAGVSELGTSGRGNDMQIGTYIEKTLNSEMSGNIIDLCPVGALTSKPYAMTARPWELKKTESIDVMDAVGSNIRVDSRGTEVMRVLPRLNEEVNEEWISDKTRFAYDGLKRQRLTLPLVREGSRFTPSTWADALEIIASKIKSVDPKSIKAIAGQLADAESLVALKDLFNKLGSENLTLEGNNGDKKAVYETDFRSNYIFNSSILGIEEADLVLLVGTNPRHEAPIINSKIRKSYINGQLDVALIGEEVKLTCDYSYLGSDASTISELISGKGEFAKRLAEAKKPMIIVGSGVAESDNAASTFSEIAKLVEKYQSKFIQEGWNGYNLLQRDASRTAALDIGYSSNPANQTEPSLVYLLNADNITTKDVPKGAFVVYQGHHGDVGAQYADVILPGSAYTEKNATYVNTEGRSQQTRSAVPPPGASREDWKIIRALSEVAGATLPYDDIVALRDRMSDVSPTLVCYDEIESTSISPLLGLSQLISKDSKASGALLNPLGDFYLTNPIARSSPTMAKCSTAFTKGETLDEPQAAFA